MAAMLAQLIRGHAWEAGLEIVDPQSVEVSVERVQQQYRELLGGFATQRVGIVLRPAPVGVL